MSQVDASELDAFRAELARATDVVLPEVRRVVERGAYNVRRDARRAVRAVSTGTYLPHYPRSIGYDLTEEPYAAEADIGPEVDRPQGGMGRGVEFGSANAPPIPHLLPAAEAEEPKLVRYLQRAVDKALQ